MNPEKLVDEALLRTVQNELYPLAIADVLRELEHREPVLVAAIRQAAAQALEHLEEFDVDSVCKANVYEAVEWSALITLEALRRAHFRLWEETLLGSILARLNPDLRKNDGDTG